MSESCFILTDKDVKNITAKPNLGYDIPKQGYNYGATGFVASKIASQTEDCVYFDTAKYILLGSKDADKAKDFIIDACLDGKKMITGEVGVNPKEGQYAVLNEILNIASQTLIHEDVEQSRLVVPLTIVSDGKEAHGVALCIDAQKQKNHVDIMILEQHAQRDNGKLDYSEEIDLTLQGLKKVFELRGAKVDVFKNDKPICRRQGVCGIVSLEVCKRLLQAENPMQKARLGTIKIRDKQVDKLHADNYKSYISSKQQTLFNALSKENGR